MPRPRGSDTDARALPRSPLEPALRPKAEQRPRSGTREARPRGVVAPLEEVCSQPEAGSAICVQSFDDSLNSAIRTTYRISLRSSSLREPRYPLLRVLVIFSSSEYKTPRNGFSIVFGVCVCVCVFAWCRRARGAAAANRTIKIRGANRS